MAAAMHRLRNGDLVGGEAVRLVAFALSAATLFLATRLIWRAPGRVELDGSPVAHDFSLFYAAGRLMREAGAAAVYDGARLGAMARSLFGEGAFVAVWPYPPPMAAAMGWLAALPYPAALALWLLVPLIVLAVFVAGATRRILPTVLVIGAPVVLLNSFIGQAGPIFSLMLAAGAWTVARGSARGGLGIGLMVLKPHLAALAPIAFLAGRAFAAFLVATAVGTAIVGLSLVAHGVPAWSAWIDALREAGRLTAEAGVDSRLPSVQAGMRLLGLPAVAAAAAQGLVGIAVAATVALVWRRKSAPEDKVAVLLLGAPLVPPYLWFYDCVTQAVAVAFVVSRAAAAGFRPFERLALGAVWLAPLVNIVIAGPLQLPAMTLAGLGAFLVVATGALRNPPAPVRQHTA